MVVRVQPSLGWIQNQWNVNLLRSVWWSLPEFELNTLSYLIMCCVSRGVMTCQIIEEDANDTQVMKNDQVVTYLYSTLWYFFYHHEKLANGSHTHCVKIKGRIYKSDRCNNMIIWIDDSIMYQIYKNQGMENSYCAAWKNKQNSCYIQLNKFVFVQ